MVLPGKCDCVGVLVVSLFVHAVLTCFDATITGDYHDQRHYRIYGVAKSKTDVFVFRPSRDEKLILRTATIKTRGKAHNTIYLETPAHYAEDEAAHPPQLDLPRILAELRPGDVTLMVRAIRNAALKWVMEQICMHVGGSDVVGSDVVTLLRDDAAAERREAWDAFARSPYGAVFHSFARARGRSVASVRILMSAADALPSLAVDIVTPDPPPDTTSPAPSGSGTASHDGPSRVPGPALTKTQMHRLRLYGGPWPAGGGGRAQAP